VQLSTQNGLWTSNEINVRYPGSHIPSQASDWEIKRYAEPYVSAQMRPLVRIVQAAVKLVLEPIFERDFLPCNYGFRPGRGCKDALREVDRWLKVGYTWVVDVDLEKYFDSAC
jgi:hypothetical protein